MNPDLPEISVLISCYFEENSIEEFHSRLSAAMESLGRPYEIIMVNDGSTDRTFEKLKEIFQHDPNVRVIIDLFKNSGQQAAVTAAVCEARGRAFIFIDSDLQLDPKEIPMLVREYDNGYDIVSGYRKERNDSLLRIIPSKIANAIMRKASKSRFRDFGCTFKIINADLVRAFHPGPFHILSMVDIISAAGRCSEVPVTHYQRKYGKSGWTFRKLWKYNMDNIVIMSERPFQIVALMSFLLGILFGIRVALGYFTPFKVMETISNGLILNAIAIVAFLLLAVLCMIGEFTLRSFNNLRQMPKYIIKTILKREDYQPAGYGLDSLQKSHSQQ